MKISKKHIIKSILRESVDQESKFYKIINNEKLVRNVLKWIEPKLIEYKQENDNYYISSFDDFNEIDGGDFNYLHNILKTQMGFDYDVANFFIAMIMSKHNLATEGIDDLENLLYKVGNDDIIPFLKSSGFYDDMNLTTYNDIEIKEDGTVLLEVPNWSSFSEEGFFGGSVTVENILSEDFTELFDLPWNYDTLLDCIKSLNNSNIQNLMENIIAEKDEMWISDSLYDFFVENEFEFVNYDDWEGHINVEENRESLLRIRYPEVIARIIVDGGYDNVKGNLLSLYNMSYNNTAEDELFKEIKNEIEDFLDSRGDWVGSVLVFDITDIFVKYIDLYLIKSNKSPSSEYHNYIEMLGNYISDYAGELNYSLDVPNFEYYYPDSDTVAEYVNESFNDYIDF
jgi:hypothetical protein